MCIISIFYAKDENVYGINKEYGLYKLGDFYIIPTVKLFKTGKYFEIIAYWLCFEYYNSYHINREENES